MRFSDITEDGTYSVNPDGSVERVNWTTGYSVAVEPISDLMLNATDEMPTYLPTGLFFGRWTNYLEDVPNGPGEFDYDTVNVVYWDVVQNIDNLLDAGNIARQRGELAIWDNLNNTEIRV